MSTAQSQPLNRASKIFLGGLPQNSTVEDIREGLSGLIPSESFEVEINYRKNKQKCLGSGVILTGQSQAEKLLKKGSISYKGRMVKILPYREGKELLKFREELSRRRVFVKNLPEDVRVQPIARYFRRYGRLESTYLRGEPSSNLKIAVVIFVERSSARLAYEDFRFGKIDFCKILNSKIFEKDIEMAFNFSDFKYKKEKRYPRRKKNMKKKFEKKSLMKALKVKSIPIPKSREQKILSISRPGTDGFCYSTDNKREYQLRLSKRRTYEGRYQQRWNVLG